MTGPAPLEPAVRPNDAVSPWPGGPAAESALWSRTAWRGRAHPVEVFAGPYSLAGHTFAVHGEATALVEALVGGDSPLLVAPGALLWRDPGLDPALAPGRAARRGRRPLQVRGPGRLACAAARPGQVFMLYLPAHTAIEVAPDRWLCAASLAYEPSSPGAGLSLDRFQADSVDGLLLVYGAGSAYELMLEPGESLLLSMAALLYRKPGTTITPLALTDGAGPAPPRLARCSGPGLLAVQTVRG